MRARGSFFNGGTIAGNIVTPLLKNGSGSPEGAVTAGVGAIYQDTTNGKLYEKVSGTGNTGWREVSPSVSGAWTPTVTGLSNCDSVSGYGGFYIRVGDIVGAVGIIGVDPTASGTATSVRMSLPISSNLGTTGDLGGVVTGSSLGGGGAYAQGDATNDAATLGFTSGGTSLTTFWVLFMYRVI